jgi:hypothetical protein
VLIEHDPTNVPGCTIRINSIEPNRIQAEAEITHGRYPRDPSPRPQFPHIHSLPPHSFLDPELTEQQGRWVGEFLGARRWLWKRSWPPSGWGCERGHVRLLNVVVHGGLFDANPLSTTLHECTVARNRMGHRSTLPRCSKGDESVSS